MIAKNGGTETDVNARIAKAYAAFHKLGRTFRSSNISKKTKIRIFKACVKPVLLYGSETWKTTEAVSRKLQVFVNSCLRKILKIFWPNTISNEQLWLLTESKPIAQDILERKWRWIGHTLRKPDNDIAKMAFEYNPQGNRRRGRPKMTWKRSVLNESKHIGS